MKREVLITADGSATISIADMDVTYHSRRGALAESMHVFINAGLRPLLHTKESISIFEMGFGTGLNALLTLKEALDSKQHISYYTTEAFPLEKEEYGPLNYTAGESELIKKAFEQMHTCAWETDCVMNDYFTFHKTNTAVENINFSRAFDLIYYDAFAPKSQPELWTTTVFEQLYRLLSPGGVLVTYCSKGDVRRSMIVAGFTVQKLQGPPGKREMLRAIREM